MREEVVNGVTYRFSRLGAKQQFNVLRRLGPVFAAAKPAAKLWVEQAAQTAQAAALAKVDPTTTAATTTATAVPDLGQLVDDIFDSVGPLATALGELSDETTDYVLGACLGVVSVNRSGMSWAPLANRTGQLMFDDLDLMTMLQLVMLVLQDNLSSFFTVRTGTSPEVQS